jgi:hypothetical protein
MKNKTEAGQVPDDPAGPAFLWPFMIRVSLPGIM